MKSHDRVLITSVEITKAKHTTAGWECRIHRQRGDIEAFFSYSKYGGKDGALQAAKKFRDSKLKEFPKLNRREIAQLHKKNNPNKKVGVSKITHTDHRPHGEYTYWYYQAFWSPAPGVHKSRKFSISKYGEKEAYRLACEARDKGLAEMRL